MLITLICVVFAAVSADATAPLQTESVIITSADDEAIGHILADWREHQKKVSYSSMTQPYFDCKAHRELLKYGRKAVPYLIRQLASQAAVEPYVGAALINDPRIKTLEQVYKYNQRRKSDVHDSTLAGWLLTGTLAELIPPDVSKERSKSRRPKAIDWLDWWRRNEGGFLFARGVSAGVVLPRDKRPLTPHVSTTVKNGLLDICAVSATYRQMIERAAAEMGIETFIGEQRYIDVIGTVWMKSVTYDEFLYMVGRDVCINGFDYRKTPNAYGVGGEKPAKPRPIFRGWGIEMATTVFEVGDDIPVTVITRGKHTVLDPSDPSFANDACFHVTTNDARILNDCHPTAAYRPTATDAMHRIELLLNRFWHPIPGEYNISFCYQGYRTPVVPIEVYPKGLKTPHVLRPRTLKLKPRNL